MVPPRNATSLRSSRGQVGQVEGEVADDRLDRHPVVGRGDLLGGVAQRALRDVDRDEAREVSGVGERTEQQPGLVAGAAAELDQGGGVAQRGDLVGVVAQDRALGLGRVVLREAGDLVEEPRALVVVEPLGRAGSAAATRARARTSWTRAALADPGSSRTETRVRLIGATCPSARRTPDSAHRDAVGEEVAVGRARVTGRA